MKWKQAYGNRALSDFQVNDTDSFPYPLLHFYSWYMEGEVLISQVESEIFYSIPTFDSQCIYILVLE